MAIAKFILFKVPFLKNATGDNRGLVGVTGSAEIATQVMAITKNVTVLGFHTHSASGTSVILFRHYHFETIKKWIKFF